MIDVTKMNGMNITINSDLIETVEDTPDTVITLTTGRKIIVKESTWTDCGNNILKSFGVGSSGRQFVCSIYELGIV